MDVVVSLRDLIGEMQMLSDEHRIFLNKATGEFTIISNDDFILAESDEVR